MDNGNYCPESNSRCHLRLQEMDVLEANKYAAQSTPHICNGT